MVQDRPNVLLICTDHWGDMYTRPAGHPVVMTPTLDQLARSGVRTLGRTRPVPRAFPPARA